MNSKVVFALVFLAFSFVLSEEIKFDAILQGSQQVPAVTTVAEGTATFTYSTDSRKLSWDISYDFVQSGISMAHIHGPAEIGENGGVLIPLDVDNEGSTGGDISGSESITIDQGNFLKNGLMYVNIHSTAEPDGEIRGQILTTSKYFHADITGAQEVPTPVLNTPFEGYADISFDYDSNEMKYEIHHDLDEATAVHIHGPAREGEAADPIFVLDETDNKIKGSVTLNNQEATFLRSGLLYINIHSEENPAGEIRGQVLVDEDGSSSGDDDWWQVGLILVAIVFAVLILSVVAVLIYKKKGDQIRAAISSNRKNQEVRASLQNMNGGVSNEPLLAEEKNV